MTIRKHMKLAVVFSIVIALALTLSECNRKSDMSTKESMDDSQKSFKCVFFDDFNDGIWKKYSGNPVMKRSQLWAESDYICEPNLLYRDGIFHMWFSQMTPKNEGTALGYATSPDGLTWTKYPHNPVLVMKNGEVHRPSVMEYDGTFYLFAVQNESGNKGPSTMRRWMSQDGITWMDERIVMTYTQPWENDCLSNTAVIVDNDGTWRMLYTCSDNAIGGHFGYAWSNDGVRWTKYEGNPVIPIIYGGDPFMVKIGNNYYIWHCQEMDHHLRICCRWSPDMIHWEPVYNNPQINYTQPWERGIPEGEGGTTAGYIKHITDATLYEAQGKVYMIYQASQTPLGVATFDGTFDELAKRLQKPPLSKWKESFYGMVESGTLKIADNGSDSAPLVAEVPEVRDNYVLESRIKCYDGAIHRVSVIMRYIDDRFFTRFWLHDAEHTFYQECRYGVFSLPVNIGPNYACDADWHDWKVEVYGDRNRLSIDGRIVGECRTSPYMMRKLSTSPVHIGFSSLDTFASIDYVRVSQK